MIPFQLTDCNQRKILTADVCQILKDLRSLAPIGIQLNHRLVWRGTFEYIYSFLLYRKRIHSAASPPLANAPQAARVRISCTCAELLIFTPGTTILLCLYRIRNQHKSQLLLYGNTAQFPPCGLSTAPAAAARHLRCQNAR